jgi:hypothetical protein
MPIESTPREKTSKLDVESVIAMSYRAEVEVPRQGDNPPPAETRPVVDAATGVTLASLSAVRVGERHRAMQRACCPPTP